MRPDYRKAQRRQRRAIKLYRRGYSPQQIAIKMEIAPTTVWRYLRRVPKLNLAKRVPNVSRLPRAPYWELHTRLGSYEIVCGRKFCSGCGRWRHLIDFPHDSHKRGVPTSRCARCLAATRNYYAQRETPAQAENRRERQRIYYEGKRREAGIPVSTAKRATVIDHVERVFIPADVIVRELDKLNGQLGEVAARAGVSERAIYRWRHGESMHVRIDVADRLAMAMGIPLALLDPDGYSGGTR